MKNRQVCRVACERCGGVRREPVRGCEMQSEFLRVDVQRLGRELRQQHLQSRVSAHRIIEKHTYAKRERERETDVACCQCGRFTSHRRRANKKLCGVGMVDVVVQMAVLEL